MSTVARVAAVWVAVSAVLGALWSLAAVQRTKRPPTPRPDQNREDR